VYIFASKADADSEQDILGNSFSHSYSENLASGLGTILVWICSSSDQIQGDMLSIEGKVSATGLGEKQVTACLGTGATELVLVSADDAESQPWQRCSLASLHCDVNKLGFCWRPRDPSPLQDRAQQIGGCEYLRLLACPTVIGYLDPALLVKTPHGPQFWLPVVQYSAVAKVKEYLEEELDLPVAEMAIFRGDAMLEDAASVKAGMVLEMKEIAPVQLRVVTGCCCEPFDGVSVAVDGQHRGVTDVYGTIGDFSLTEGEHSLRLEHTVLGQQGLAMKDITVRRGKPNIFTVLADMRFFVYATDPDPEDRDPEDAENCVPDPSCVWVAANPEHIADDAVPLLGHVIYQTAEGSDVKAPLSSYQLQPSVLHLGTTHTQKSCLMSSVGVQCTRPGFVWEPKEPSPFSERLAEIGGCEFLRVLACPVALGFLKPAITVQCANGRRDVLALSSYPTLAHVRTHLAEVLELSDATGLQIVKEDGQVLNENNWTTSAMRVACARPDESVVLALELLRKIDFQEQGAKEEAEAKALDYFKRVEVAELEVLEMTTRDGSWLADLSRKFSLLNDHG
jgi:hypothetical protein